MLEKTTRMNSLLDFYQALLTDKQRMYMELYYLEDYSLGEISDSHKVSRQAVYDNIKRTEKILESYEDKLELYSRFVQRKELLNELESAFGNVAIEEFRTLLQKIKELD